MGTSTGIEWTDATWNPIGGCSIASPGCINCYAQSLAGSRLKQHPLYTGTTDMVKGKHVFNGHLTAAPLDHPVWTWPLRWRGARKPRLGLGKPSMIFVGDMSDLFHEDRPDEIIDRVFAVMALCPHHIFQVLTKRAERMRDYCSRLKERSVEIAQRAVWLGIWDDPEAAAADTVNALDAGFLPNVWFGVSAERQQEADERIPYLLATPASVRFVSCEPLLDLLRLDSIGVFGSLGLESALCQIDQVIIGGESGKNARPMHPEWALALRDQCGASGTAFFFKQWGGLRPKSGGRQLDGVEWSGFPAGVE
jgi:protein gp37